MSVGKREMKAVNATSAVEASCLTKPEDKAHALEVDVMRWRYFGSFNFIRSALFSRWPCTALTCVLFVTQRLCGRELRAKEQRPLLPSSQFSASFLQSPPALETQAFALCVCCLAELKKLLTYGVGRTFLTKFTFWIQEIRIHGFIYVTYGAIRHLDSSLGSSMDVWTLYVSSHPHGRVWSLLASPLGTWWLNKWSLHRRQKEEKQMIS